KFWGVQAECAAAPAKVGTGAALEKITAATRIKHPKARRAVARALGEWRDEQAAKALLPLARRDPSYSVEADAAAALGRTRVAKAWNEVARSTRKASHLDGIRSAAFAGLVDLNPAK